jgi:hypothetical protein
MANHSWRGQPAPVDSSACSCPALPCPAKRLGVGLASVGHTVRWLLVAFTATKDDVTVLPGTFGASTVTGQQDH